MSSCGAFSQGCRHHARGRFAKTPSVRLPSPRSISTQVARRNPGSSLVCRRAVRPTTYTSFHGLRVPIRGKVLPRVVRRGKRCRIFRFSLLHGRSPTLSLESTTHFCSNSPATHNECSSTTSVCPFCADAYIPPNLTRRTVLCASSYLTDAEISVLLSSFLLFTS